MPVETLQLQHRPQALLKCPRCDHEPFFGFMRGEVQSGWRRALRRPYCAVICQRCKHVVAWEKPQDEQDIGGEM